MLPWITSDSREEEREAEVELEVDLEVEVESEHVVKYSLIEIDDG